MVYMTTVVKNKSPPILFNCDHPETLEQDLSGINSNFSTWELILCNYINDNFQLNTFVLAFIWCVLFHLSYIDISEFMSI